MPTSSPISGKTFLNRKYDKAVSSLLEALFLWYADYYKAESYASSSTGYRKSNDNDSSENTIEEDKYSLCGFKAAILTSAIALILLVVILRNNHIDQQSLGAASSVSPSTAITPVKPSVEDALPLQISTPSPSPSQIVNTIGNTPGNIVNGGYVAQQGDWIYYCNVSLGYTLYKIRTDGSERTKLSDDSSLYINVIGDWVLLSEFL